MNPKSKFKRPNCEINDNETFYRDIYLLSPLTEPFYNTIKVFEVNQERIIQKQNELITDRSTAAESNMRFASTFRFSSIQQRLTSFAKDVR